VICQAGCFSYHRSPFLVAVFTLEFLLSNLHSTSNIGEWLFKPKAIACHAYNSHLLDGFFLANRAFLRLAKTLQVKYMSTQRYCSPLTPSTFA
jgi:hypothetical protein